MPVSSPPIRDGAVLVEDGRIRSVGPLSEVGRENPDAEVRFFPNYAMVPGAVNAHAHLGFRRKDRPEGGTFSGWLSKLIERLPEKESWRCRGRPRLGQGSRGGGDDLHGRVIALRGMPAAARRKRHGRDRLRRVLPARDRHPGGGSGVHRRERRASFGKVCPNASTRRSACILPTPSIPSPRVWRREGRGSWGGSWRYTSPRAPRRWSSSGTARVASPTSSAATSGEG